jgi:WD40 repeat protein
VSGGEARPTKFGDGLGVYSAAFSPDGRRVATGSLSGATRIWDVSGLSPKIVKMLSGPNGAISQLAFSRDGTQLAAANEATFEVRVWNLNKVQPAPKTLDGHTSPIDQLEFSADGSRLLTATPDNSKAIRVWDIAGPRPGALVLDIGDTTNRLVGAEFSSDGESVLASYTDGTARIFPIPSADRLLDVANRSLTRCLTAAQREDLGLPVPPTAPAERYSVKRPPC